MPECLASRSGQSPVTITECRHRHRRFHPTNRLFRIADKPQIDSLTHSISLHSAHYSSSFYSDLTALCCHFSSHPTALPIIIIIMLLLRFEHSPLFLVSMSSPNSCIYRHYHFLLSLSM